MRLTALGSKSADELCCAFRQRSVAKALQGDLADWTKRSRREVASKFSGGLSASVALAKNDSGEIFDALALRSPSFLAHSEPQVRFEGGFDPSSLGEFC